MNLRRTLWLFIPVSLVTHTATAAPYERADDGGFMLWHGYGHMMFGGLMMLAFWILLVVVVVLAVRWLVVGQGQHGSMPRQSSALHILEERYARGEIDREEFEERKRHLSV